MLSQITIALTTFTLEPMIDLELLKTGALPAADMTPRPNAPAVKMPALMWQVRDDSWTKNPEDAQKILIG